MADKEEENQIVTSRDRKVGETLGGICYYLFKKGYTREDFPDLVTEAAMNGIDVGDFNHSHNFPDRFLPFVAAEIKSRIKKFLNTHMVQTGFRPFVKISADKATLKHRTRQIISVIVLIPDSQLLLQAMFLNIR